MEESCTSLVDVTVERFGGKSTEEIALRLSRKKSSVTGIGFGRNVPEKGDASTFFRSDWRVGMMSALLSHFGKHTPLLPLTLGTLPVHYKEYL